MSPYENLLAHIDKHKYLRGAHKGDAPLDPKRRRKSENRVTNRGAYAAVIRWRTEILQAYPDGRVVLNCEGWGSSMTTRLAMNHALAIADIRFGWLHSVRYKGVSQLALGQWRYYDGMELVPSPDGYKPTVLQSYRGRRKDKAQTQEFREGMKTSGFNALFPMLYANATSEDRPFSLNPNALHETLTDPSLAYLWPGAVAYYKFRSYEYHYDTAAGKGLRVWQASEIGATRAAITQAATAHMHEMYDTNEFSI